MTTAVSVLERIEREKPEWDIETWIIGMAMVPGLAEALDVALDRLKEGK